jgi:subtilase family serine protease
MRRTSSGLTAVTGALILAGSLATATAASAAPTAGGAAARTVVSSTTTALRSCAVAKPGHVGCLALLKAKKVTYANGLTALLGSNATPSGYGPSDLRSAYNLPSTAAGTGQTVAIVDAFDDPTAEADLATYRSQFGESACTTANGCFRKVNENGGSTPPAVDTGWAQEESLDLDMVSAIAPNAHILLVEAASATDADLVTSENEAAALGATEISNSYGGSEDASETSENAAFNHPGIAITASAGDGGYGVEFPAAVPSVTSVGGTSLNTATTARGWSETVWGSGALSAAEGGTGSGCSTVEPKPAWQTDTGCANRTVADVSAVADPNTGVAVFDSTPNQAQSGWLVFGGTSVSSPIIAGVYALAGNAASTNGASFAYSHTGSLNDVTSGSNGVCGSYLCTGGAGYDGPTGLGTPAGTGAF